MTSYLFGAVTVLAAWGWGPRILAFVDQQHRRWARRTKQRGLPLPETSEAFINSYAPPIWHGETTTEFKAIVRNLVYEEPT
jgi:hypothetical protein